MVISKQKNLLITGSNSRIGSKISLMAAKKGFSVALHFNSNSDKVNYLTESINKMGVDVFSVKADLRNKKEIKQMFKKIDKKWKNLNGVVNNAAISGKRKSLLDLKDSEVDEIFKINFFANFYILKETIIRMKKTGGGSIVNISTNALKTGGFNLSAYLASKEALESLSKTGAREFAADNIRINIVRPGIIGPNDQSLDKLYKKKEQIIPMKRIGKPEDIANSVLWLLSEKSSYLTGSTISVSGGY